jgi:hypothetical protein
MALEFFPGMPLVQAVIGASALLAALAVVLIQVPSKSGKILLPVIILAWAGLLPGALMAQVVSSLPPLPAEAHRLLPDFAEGVEIEEERNAAVKSAIFASFAAESLLLAFALKLRIASVASGLLPASGGQSSAAGGFAAAAGMQAIDRAADFLGQCMPAYALQPGAAKPFLKGPASAAMQRLATEGMAWAPTACNIVTLLCFSLCLVLNNAFTGGSPWGVILLSPVLLLLCQDPVLCRSLTDQRRYFPPTAATGTFLLGSVALEVYSDMFGLGYFYLLSGDWVDITKNVILAVLCIPTLVDLLTFMWIKHRLTPARALIPAAVASVGIFMADFEAVQLLGGVCIVGGVYLAATASATRTAGRKLI